MFCDLRNKYPTIHLIQNCNDKTNRTERRTLDLNSNKTVGTCCPIGNHLNYLSFLFLSWKMESAMSALLFLPACCQIPCDSGLGDTVIKASPPKPAEPWVSRHEGACLFCTFLSSLRTRQVWQPEAPGATGRHVPTEVAVPSFLLLLTMVSLLSSGGWGQQNDGLMTFRSTSTIQVQELRAHLTWKGKPAPQKVLL